MASVEEASADRKERTKKLPQEIKQAHEELEKLAEKQQIEPYHDTLRIEKLDKEFDVFKWKSRANVEDKAAATEIDPNAQQYFYRACTMEEAHLWLDSRSQEDAIAKEGQPWASYADYSEKYLDGVDRNILLETCPVSDQTNPGCFADLPAVCLVGPQFFVATQFRSLWREMSDKCYCQVCCLWFSAFGDSKSMPKGGLKL
eukprot:g14138.t1